MKNRHNKKRNTAFVFEALSREATVAIIKGDHERMQKVVSMQIKYFFKHYSMIHLKCIILIEICFVCLMVIGL